LEGSDNTAAPAACSTRSISREPPRIFMPLASPTSTSGRARLAAPPACQIQVMMTTPLLATNLANSWPIGLFFQESPCS
jgi:hypothetical protein